MTQGVAGGRFVDAGLAACIPDRSLQDGFIHMVAPGFATAWINAVAPCGEHVLPGEFRRRIRVFARQCVRQVDPAKALRQVLRMQDARTFHLFLQALTQALR